MSKKDRISTKPRDTWKNRIGVEFSGLERTRDFLIGIAFFVVLVVVAMLIAFFAFG